MCRHWEKMYIQSQGERVKPALSTQPGLPASRTEEVHFWGLSCPVCGPLSQQLEQNNSAPLYCPSLWLSVALSFSPCLLESHWVIVSDFISAFLFLFLSYLFMVRSLSFSVSPPVFFPLLFLCYTILSLPRAIRGTSCEMFRTAPVLQRLLEKAAALSPSLFSFLLHYFLSIPFSFTP